MYSYDNTIRVHKNIKYLYCLILKLLGKKYEIPSQPYRDHLNSFFYHTDWAYENTIVSVRAYKKKGSVTLVVETHMPGVFIGKQGYYINLVTEFLNTSFNTPIVIELVESKMWRRTLKKSQRP